MQYISYAQDFNYSNVKLPMNCTFNAFLGVMCLILFVIAFTINLLVLWLFVSCKLYKKPLHILNLNLILSNLIGTIVGLPMIFARAFACRFLFGKFGCWGQAFGMFFLGSLSIYLLMAITIERYLVTFRPKSVLSVKLSLILLGVCLALSTLWSTGPLYGWSSYTAEGILVSCAVEWYNTDVRSFSYNIIMLVFLFLVPLFIMIYFSILFIKKLFSIKTKVNPSGSAKKEMKRFNKNFHLTKLIMLSITSFLASWAPYAISVAIRLFFNDHLIGPTAQTMVALVSKTYLLWHALIQLNGNKHLKDKIPWKRSFESTNPTYRSREVST